MWSESNNINLSDRDNCEPGSEMKKSPGISEEKEFKVISRECYLISIYLTYGISEGIIYLGSLVFIRLSGVPCIIAK